MPLIENVFNASLEDFKLQIYSKPFRFHARSITKMEEKFIPVIEAEHKDRGLVVLRPGDDFKAKEREALLNYLQLLDIRIKNYQSRLDEDRKKGATIDEPAPMVEAKKWKKEIIKKLSIDAPVHEHKSFLDAEISPEVAALFDNKPVEIKETPKKRGKAKSFTETDISEEVVV